MNNKKFLFLSIVTVMLVIVATFSSTYAYLATSAKQEDANVVQTTCFGITMQNVSNINITSYPVSDAKGLQSAAHTFKVNNTCATPVSYQIILNVKNTTSDDMLKSIFYSLDGTNTNILSNAAKITLPTGASASNVKASYLIDVGTFSGIGEKSFSLRLWIASHAGNYLMGQRFEAEVMVYASQGNQQASLQTKTITNLVSDASFENGNWNNGVMDTTAKYVRYGNTSLKMVGRTTSPELLSTNRTKIALNPSHIYYGRYEVYHEGASGTAGIYWPAAEPPIFDSKSLGNANTWNIVSNVRDRSSFTEGTYPFRLDFNNNKTASTVWYDGVVLIDLTATFGAGAEPDKAWCDVNIPFFEGTKVIKFK